MTSISLGVPSRRLLTPFLFSSLPTRRILGNPAFTTPSFSQKKSPLLSSNYKTQIARASTTAAPVGKEDPKPNSPNEKVVKVSSWIDYLPNEIQPCAELARVEKPIGTWLFFFPFAWSATLAASAGSLPDFKTLALFACAAPLLRGAGCTINDFFDRDIDKMVERTKQRPIASGAVTPLQALCFFAFQLLLSHGILLQLTNYSAIYEAALMFLISTYPLMKRLTYWPQAYLGLVMNWAALFGWYAIKGSLLPSVVYPLFVAGFFWTLMYDTIYAHQDKEFDIKIGVKSTALKFGDSAKEWITGFAIACVGSLAFTGYNAALGWPYYVFLAAASGHLAWQIGTANLSSPADCGLCLTNGLVPLFAAEFYWEKSSLEVCKKTQQVEKVLEAEVRAILWSLEIAKESNFSRILIESDCLVAITEIKEDLSFWEGGSLIFTIQHLALGFEHCDFSYVSSNANILAHSLARLAYQVENQSIWLNALPDIICDLELN